MSDDAPATTAALSANVLVSAERLAELELIEKKYKQITPHLHKIQSILLVEQPPYTTLSTINLPSNRLAVESPRLPNISTINISTIDISAISAKNLLFNNGMFCNYPSPSTTSTIITSMKRSTYFEERYKLPADAPPPQEIAAYVVTYCNGTGHLEYFSEPKIDFFKLHTLLQPYHVREIRQITKIINGNIYNYFKLFEDVPLKRNVVVKMDNEWVTFCLDYSGLDWHVAE